MHVPNLEWMVVSSSAFIASGCGFLILLLAFGGREVYLLPFSTTVGGLRQPTLKLQRMPTHDASVNPGYKAKPAQDWMLSCNKWFRANVILW